MTLMVTRIFSPLYVNLNNQGTQGAIHLKKKKKKKYQLSLIKNVAGSRAGALRLAKWLHSYLMSYLFARLREMGESGRE